METKKIKNKWGFGMAPLKAQTNYSYRKAVYAVHKFVKGEPIQKEVLLDSISVYKGLINRILKQDQWDWFTVYEMFDSPRHIHLIKIPSALIELRNAVKDDPTNVEKKKEKLVGLGLIRLSEKFLGFVEKDSNDGDGAGYVYILSSRENKEVLKIGMTTRSMVQRVNEINSATGVVFPYSPRKIIRVINAKVAETIVFEALADYRIRKDREFFCIPFGEAVKIIDAAIDESNLRTDFDYMVTDNPE